MEMTKDCFYGLSASDGLHVLKDEWCQKSHFGEQSEYLEENLQAAIKATIDAAPVRVQGYRLDREPTLEIDETQRERRWERATYIRWSNENVSPVVDIWSRLIGFQIPLFDEQEKKGWGYIDILGIVKKKNRLGLSIIELKKEPSANKSGKTDSTESPLRMVLEGVSYAIAMRKNWSKVKVEVNLRLEALEIEQRLTDEPMFTIVGAAPAAYWMDWLPYTGKGKEISEDCWRKFGKLLSALSEKDNGFPVSFLSLSGDCSSPGSLAAQPLSGLPYC